MTPRPRYGNPARRAAEAAALAKPTQAKPTPARAKAAAPAPTKPASPPAPKAAATKVEAKVAIGDAAADQAAEPTRASRIGELAIRVVAVVTAVWAAVLLALVGAFLTPFRLGGVLVPISLLLAVGGNVLTIWFAYRFTRSRLLGLLPGIVWVGLTMVAAGMTTERDFVLLQSNWVAITYLYTGCAAVGVCAYRLIVPRAPRQG